MTGGAAAVPASMTAVVLSRGRPAHLALCLASLARQRWPVPVVVVTDRPEAVPDWAEAVAFGPRNVAAARNAGIAAARTALIAFLDDDAVAEPGWTAALAAPFAEPRVGAATGLVRGPDGVAWDAPPAALDPIGLDRPLAIPEDTALHPPDAPLKPVGTNAAFRRAALAEIGGFDPAFAYYLDEVDLALRLAARGWWSALVPTAQVHHAAAPGPLRRRRRTPGDLTSTGRSIAALALRHAAEPQAARAAHRAAVRGRLDRHVAEGRLDPLAARARLKELSRGLDAPPAEPAPPPGPPADPKALAPPAPRPARGIALVGGLGHRRRLAAAARALDADGWEVTVLDLRPSWRPMRVRFDGVWWHRGGVLGRAGRSGPALRWRRPAAHAAAELARIAPLRPVGPILAASRRRLGPVPGLPAALAPLRLRLVRGAPPAGPSRVNAVLEPTCYVTEQASRRQKVT